MFRASDIFGRGPGKTPDRPTVAAKAAAAQKRLLTPASARSRTWDPATGQFIEEEIPVEVAELMGHKRIKAEASLVGSATRTLGPASVGLQPVKSEKSRGPANLPAIGPIDTSAPSVEYQGFSKVELNNRYFEKPNVAIHSRPTYWSDDGLFFIYWQGEVQRWSICDASSFSAVKAGQYPGWAYKEDHRHLCQANGWMEAWNGEWREPELEVTFRSSSHHKPQWDDQLVQKGIVTVEFKGFSMKEINTRFFLRANQVIQGRPSYWDNSGVYFIYWQQQLGRWAVCDLKCIEAVKSGQCPGWAYRSDSGHFANACGWMESRGGNWTVAMVETAVIGACTRGLKVEFSGFSKRDLNTQFIEKADEEIQGRVTFWDSSSTYFIYWQSSMKRWAICDKVSLHQAKSGLAPGWAYRTDPQHFAKSSGWMEVWGRDWKQATVVCTVLEGTVRDDSSLVKAEPSEEAGTHLSVDQYRILVQKVYAENNPAKLSDIGHLLEKYKGREHELYRQVCEKYQVDADEFLTELPPEAAPATKAEDTAKPAAAPEEDDELGSLENAELPDLTATEYAVLIQSIYETYNPKKLQDMGRLLLKYRNRERELYHEVCKKYGAHPAKFHAKHQQQQQ